MVGVGRQNGGIMKLYLATVTTTYKVYADSEEEAYDLLHEFPDGGDNVNVGDQDFWVEEADFD